MASIWSMVNQLQLYLLLFLTHSYIPDEIQIVVKGFKFSINIYEFVPIRRIGSSQSVFDRFDFGLTNSILESFGINSDSTMFNMYPTLGAFILVLILHLFVYLLWKLFLICIEWRNCNWFINFIFKLITKILNFLTFGFYIRNTLELTQCMLISSVYEIYKADFSNTLKFISFTFAISWLLVFAILVTITIYLSLSSYKLIENRHNNLGEFFVGLKQLK